MRLPLAFLCCLPFVTAQADAQATYEQRHDSYFDDISTRKINTGQTDGPHRAGRTGFWTTQGKLQRGNESSGVWSNLSATIANADGSPDAGGANGGFSGWPGMDTYLRWQHRFPQSIKDQYYTEYTTMPNYGKGSTPNQRIMWAAACKLACETWGVPAVTSVSNAANRYGDPTGKAYMMAICDRTVKYNFEERWAKHYLQYTLGPLRSIADLSTDAELANRARMTWNWGWMDIASFSFKGRWAIPAGRGSMTQDGNSSDISEFGSWLMFEGTPRANPLDMDQSLLYTQPKVGQAHLVTQPPILPEMLEAATDRSKPFTRRGMARVHETQFATSHVTKDWALYSQLEADTTLNADGTLKIKDLDNNGVPSNDWSSERWAVLWDETGPAGLTMKAPTGYGWCQGCGLGPHEDIVQHEGTITGIFNIPATSDWQYTRDSIPTNTTAVINDSATTGRLYLHYSKVLVAITRSDIGNFTWPPASQTFCNKRGYAVECASLDEYPQSTAAARLAAFKADIEANPPDFSHVNDAVPRMIYTTRDGTVLDVTYGQGGKINGDPVDYEAWPIHESPWARQDQMGNMWVFGKDRHLLWNYKNWTERSDYRPTATTSAPVAAASSVDVDLSTRVTDTETASAALNYRITGSNNGSAVILPDGKTARFTPAANIAGESNFTFSAGGEFPDPRFVFHYDYEQANPLAGGIVKDQSSNDRHATASVGGVASLTGETDLPAALGTRSTTSLRVLSTNFGSAKLSRQIHPATLNFSNHDWTFATWFKRASHADDDFLFYIGNSDGNSGNVDELQLYLPAQSKTLALRHWTAANVLDVNLATSATVNAGEWHHVAVQYDRTSFNTGVVKLYIDGELAATTAPITFALNQTGPVFIGGPALNTALTRNFNGWLDDTVLARGELAADEIQALASSSASHLGGVKLEQTVRVIASPLPPASLAATASNNTIQLTWSASSGAASYTVKRATSASGPFTTLASDITGTSFADATTAFGTTYQYLVTASNPSGESTDSNLASAQLPATDPSIWNGGTMAAWTHGARIAFPGYSGTETLSNIPLLVRLDATKVPGFSYSQLAFANGADLRFTDSSGSTELAYEIETWDPAGTSLVWVKVPSLSASTSILAFWGNPAATATAAPNSLSGLSLWLKADAITGLTDGATLTTWNDSSTNARNATVLAGTPTFETSELNGQPVVRFSANGETSLQFPSLNTIRTVFWVVKETTPGAHFLLGDDNTYHFHRGASGNLWDASYCSGNVRNGSTKLNGTTVNGTTTPLGNGWKLVSVVTAGNCEASRIAKDRNIAARSWDGDIAEIIIYDRALSANEEQLIGGYLSQKYALPASYSGAAPTYTVNGSAWTGGYTGVWHLNSTAVNDSTATPQNTTSNATLTSAGKVASALVHNGASQHAIIPHATELNLSNNYELSGWLKLSAADKPASGDYCSLFTKETDASTRNWWLSINSDGRLWWKSSAGIDVTSPTDLADGQWHHFSAVHDGATARLYLDGAEVATGSAPASEALTTWAVRLGSQNSTRWFKGTLDEFRVSNVKRSAAWVRAVYENIHNPAFVRIAPATPYAAAFAPMLVNLPATAVTSSSATLSGTLVSTGGSTTTVTIYHGSSDGGTTPANWAGSLSLGARPVGNFGGAISGLPAGTVRYFRAFASNATGGTWAPVTSSLITPTATPTGLSATPASGLVSLGWSAAPGAASYRLKRSTHPGGPYSPVISGILGTSAMDPGVTVGTSYYYVLSTTNPGGESPNSAELAVTVLAPPATPTATAGNNSVALSWSSVAGATSYTLRRATNPGGPFTTLASGLTGTSHNDATALNGSTYFYQITALNAGSESEPSHLATATPSATIAAPTGLATTPASTSALLTWNAVAGATTYRVKRATTSGGPYNTVASALLVPNFDDSGLTNGTMYFYVVSALNGSIESANSAQISIVPAVTPTTFTTASAGNWSNATWSPQQPISAFETTIVFNNTGSISSNNNLGLLLANKLNLTNGAVNLTGDALFLAGSSPAVTSTANVAHTLDGILTLDAVTTFNIPSNNTTVSGVIHGNGGVTKTGAGTLVLSGANSNTGPTTVSAGTLKLRHSEALGSSNVTVSNGASLDLQDNITLSGHRATLTGQGSGTGGVLRNVSGNNTWAGEITAVAASGITRISSDAGTLTLTGEINQDNGGSDQLVFQGNGDTVITGAIDGNSAVTRSSAGSGVVSLLGDNTYTGQTLINGGILEINTINRLSADESEAETALNASSLGLPTTVANGTINIGNSSTTATLRFIGPNTTTDRVLNLAGTSGGAVIEQNGSGKLTFLSALTATGAGNKTLTLTGTSEGMLAGAIVDNSASNKTSLVKSGAGLWSLGGTNTYTGTTSVNAGTLLLQNANIAAGGNVTVATSATFGGSGTVTPNSTVNGNLALTPGALTFGGTLTFGASARVKWNLTENSAATGFGRISAPAANIGTGAVVDIVLNSADGLADFANVFWSTPRSWPVLNALSRGGTFTIGTISTDSAGHPASGYGSFAIEQTATGVNLTWTPLSAMEQWRFTHFGVTTNTGNAADNADPDNDGVANFVEFNNDTLPNDATSVPAFVWHQAVSGNWSTATNWNLGLAPTSNPATRLEFLSGLTSLSAGTITPNNDNAGTFSLNSLRLAGSGSGAIAIHSTGGTLRFHANGEVQPLLLLNAYSTNLTYTLTNPIDLTADLTIDGANTGNFVLNGPITGSGGITRIGINSRLVLGGSNSHTGPTVLSAGVTAITTADNLGAPNAPLTLDGGTLQILGSSLTSLSALNRPVNFTPDQTVTLDIATSTHSVTADLTFDQGTGGLTKNGAGTLVLSQPNNYSGPTTLSAGTLAISATTQLGDPAAPLIFNGGNLRVTGTALANLSDLARPITLTPTKNVGIDVADAAHTFAVDLPLDQTTGTFTKFGAGTLELDAANTFTGNITASNGVLRIFEASALGGATKDVFCTSGTARIELDGSSGDISLPATTRFQTSGAQATGALRNVAGNNRIAGQFLLTTGGGNTQIISDGGTLNLTGPITTSPSAGARTLFLGGSANGITSGGIADNAANIVSVTKNGSGTWEIRGTNTHSGLTTASAGTLALTGSLAGPLTATGGTFAPLGSPAVAGNLAINSAAKFRTRINGSTPGTEYDQLSAAANVTLAGTLELVSTPGLSPGTTFTLIQKSSPGAVSGTFSGLPQNATFAQAPNYVWQVSYTGGDGNDVVLSLAAMSPLESFRFQYFGTIANTGSAADSADPDGDGRNNLAEFNASTNPLAVTAPVVLITSPAAEPVTVAALADTLHLSAAIQQSSATAPLSWAWSQVSGPGVATFAGSNNANATVTFDTAGTYVLQATATLGSTTASATRTVHVATPATLTFRQGENGYTHAATFIRGDTPTWNSGTRDQLLIGRNSNTGMRGLFAFDLSGVPANATVTSASFDLWAASTGSGTVNSLQLRALLKDFTEGSGDGSSSANGANTGADWNSRTGPTTANLWGTAGGQSGTDFSATVIGSLAGLNATTTSAGTQHAFTLDPAFVTEANAALAAARPLRFMLTMTSDTTAGSSVFARFASDNHPNPAYRPRLTLGFTANPAPVIATGAAPNATSGAPAALTGSTSGAISSAWSLVSGPGSASFSDPNNPATTVTFSQPGLYTLRLMSSNASGTVSRTLAVTATASNNPAIFADWQELTWPGESNSATISPDADPDSDGLTNLTEWALHLDATAPSVHQPGFIKNGAVLDFTYTRRKTAPGEAAFTVEWSDTLAAPWTSVVSDPPVALDATRESVHTAIPAGPNRRRFVRLRVVQGN
jgi:autotransporter-associated beta strand protein